MHFTELISFLFHFFPKKQTNILTMQQFSITKMYFSVSFLPSNRKKNPLLMFNNYTYKKQWECTSGKVIWYCSKRKRGCKAFVHSRDGIFTPGDLIHTHPAPPYMRGNDGSWVKL